MAMLVSRSAANQQSSSPDSNLLDIWAYNTYFYTMLKFTKDVSKSTKSLTKNGESATIFSKDVVFVPIHHAETHWCMDVLNFKKRQIEYYDSLGSGERKIFFDKMKKYLKAEYDKKQQDFDFPELNPYYVENCPQQTNANDCGVFAMTYAEYISRSAAPFNFGQVCVKMIMCFLVFVFLIRVFILCICISTLHRSIWNIFVAVVYMR